jgi:hypothetical protein
VAFILNAKTIATGAHSSSLIAPDQKTIVLYDPSTASYWLLLQFSSGTNFWLVSLINCILCNPLAFSSKYRDSASFLFIVFIYLCCILILVCCWGSPFPFIVCFIFNHFFICLGEKKKRKYKRSLRLF